MGPLPFAATGSHLNCAAPGLATVCDSVFASAAFSSRESGRISMGAVAEVSVRDIGTCVMTVQADSATAADSRPMARQCSSPRSMSKLIPPLRSASALQTDRASSPGLASQGPNPEKGDALRLRQGNMVPRSGAAPDRAILPDQRAMSGGADVARDRVQVVSK